MFDIPAVLLGSVERAPWGWMMLFLLTAALIKSWPVIQLQTLNAKATLRGERIASEADCMSRIDAVETKHAERYGALEKRVQSTERQSHALEIKLVGTLTAYRILHADLSERAPDCSAINQAELVIRETWDGPMPSSAGI
jgi:hypothetical protein